MARPLPKLRAFLTAKHLSPPLAVVSFVGFLDFLNYCAACLPFPPYLAAMQPSQHGHVAYGSIEPPDSNMQNQLSPLIGSSQSSAGPEAG
jgi:hypothetical protein